jgi:hypothetical protein
MSQLVWVKEGKGFSLKREILLLSKIRQITNRDRITIAEQNTKGHMDTRPLSTEKE